MHILVSCDENYLPPLKTMLYSLYQQHRDQAIQVHLIHSDIAEELTEDLREYLKVMSEGYIELKQYPVGERFESAFVNRYYSIEMYYYLLAGDVLPDEIDRVIYIDPDCLVINPLNAFYNMDLVDHMMAAAQHSALPSAEINYVRLKTFADTEIESYFNAGFILMDLQAMRERTSAEAIFEYIQDAHLGALVLPDQDVLNVLYHDDILLIDEHEYNYDPRFYTLYLARDNSWSIERILRETKVIHYCGKHKPWNRIVGGQFTMLYKYFQIKAESIQYDS